MTRPQRTLGTLVRHLLELMDGDVEAAYGAAGLTWRPRYTPVMRILMYDGPASIRALSRTIGITHSAVSQTVSEMRREGLVDLRPGKDARERIVTLAPKATAMIPALKRQWEATNAAADTLDAELSIPLSQIASETIDALTRTPFAERIRRAAEVLDAPAKP